MPGLRLGWGMFGGYCGIRLSLRCENTTKIGMPSPSPGPGRGRPNGPAGPVRSAEQFESPDLPHIVQATAMQRDTLPRSNTALRSAADLCARHGHAVTTPTAFNGPCGGKVARSMTGLRLVGKTGGFGHPAALIGHGEIPAVVLPAEGARRRQDDPAC